LTRTNIKFWFNIPRFASHWASHRRILNCLYSSISLVMARPSGNLNLLRRFPS
jgi:hypothetical protein